MFSPLMGIIFALLIAWLSFYQAKIPLSFYQNSAGLILVIGGTLSAAVITFSFSDIRLLLATLIKVFRQSKISEQRIIRQLLDFGQNPRRMVTQQDRRKYHPFLLDGLNLISNDFTKETINEVLTTSIIERKNYHLKSVDMLKTLSKYPTAFGMMGTIIGLVSLLKNLGSGTSEMMNVGPNMSLALLTTLYGLVISNWFFHPVSENLYNKAVHDLLIRKIILRGILLLKEGNDALYIQETLNSYIAPKLRRDYYGEIN